MGKLKRAILLNFRTKVIVPIVGVMVLLMATSMWLVNGRVTRQVQGEAAEQLATADAVLNHIQQLRMESLLNSFRRVESEPVFKAHAALFRQDSDGLSESAQKNIRELLHSLLREKFAKVIMAVPREGPRLIVADDAWIRSDEFENACAGLTEVAMA